MFFIKFSTGGSGEAFPAATASSTIFLCAFYFSENNAFYGGYYSFTAKGGTSSSVKMEVSPVQNLLAGGQVTKTCG